MSIIIPANSAVSGDFTAANSLMFNYADGAYLNRTLGTPTNNIKWTWSAWVKRARITGSAQRMFYAENGAGSNYTTIQFDDEQKLQWFNEIGGTDMQLITSRQFKDIGAWMHLMFVYDSANATAADRQIIYVNGERQTAFLDENTAGSNVTTAINQAVVHNIASGPGAQKFYGGYMAEVVFTDGQALAVTDVGEFDEDSGIWKPKSVSGLTFGNNGFYLDFQDSSALGNDAVGSNNFTTNNLAATDQGTDTCTNNFCTMNPLDNYFSAATFSSGNNTVATAAAPVNWVASTFQVNKGKWYAECKPTAGTGSALIGFAGSTSKNSTQILETAGFFGGNYVNNGEYFFNGSGGAYAASFSNGNIISVYLDLDNNFVYFAKNGTLQNSGDPTSGGTGTGGKAITAAASVTNGGYAFACGDGNTATRTFDWNFGSPYYAISSGNADGNGYGNFEYAVPSGYFALCTKNLAEYG